MKNISFLFRTICTTHLYPFAILNIYCLSLDTLCKVNAPTVVKKQFSIAKSAGESSYFAWNLDLVTFKTIYVAHTS